MNGPARPALADLMRPRSVCVVGASEDQSKFGGRIMRNLLDQQFQGGIFPINPKRDQIFGHRTFASIDTIGRPIDLVIVAVPRAGAIAAIQECARAGAGAVIVTTAQFSDSGTAEGRALEQAMVEIAHQAGMRIIGPNCIGIVSPVNRFALCPSPVLPGHPPLPGALGLVSQSGAMMGTALDRARVQGIGFSHCISIGNQADLDLCDFVDFMIDDPATRVICTYVEGFKSASKLVSAARRARAAGKPWLMLKAGRTAAGAAAAFSHTASIAGEYPALAAWCRDTGILLMDDAEAMIVLGALLCRSPLPQGSQTFALISPSGGGCAVGADRLGEQGLPLALLSAPTIAQLAPMYPAGVNNPLDVGAADDGASMSTTTQAHRAVLSDPAVDLCLTVLTAAPDITAFARMTCEATRDCAKPLLAVVMTGEAGQGARTVFRDAGVPFVDAIDTAVRVLHGWSRWATPAPSVDEEPWLQVALPARAPPGSWDERTTKEALASWGIRVNEGRFAPDPQQAGQQARSLRPPLVLKVVSAQIVHKSDAGGVVLDLRDATEVVEAAIRMASAIRDHSPDAVIDGYLVQEQAAGGIELLVGARRDPQFGMMLVLGAGGLWTELLSDVSIAPAPVSPSKARAMLQELRIAPLLAGARGRPAVDWTALCETISRFSVGAAGSAADLSEIEINPLIARPDGCVAVDARAKSVPVPVDSGA